MLRRNIGGTDQTLRLLAGIAHQQGQGIPLDKAFASARPPVWDKRRPLLSKALQRHGGKRWGQLLLQAQQIDTQARLERHWRHVRDYLVAVLSRTGLGSVEAEELTVLPGLDELKGTGLLDGRLPPGFSVPMPSDEATLREDEDPLEDGDLDLGLAPRAEERPYAFESRMPRLSRRIRHPPDLSSTARREKSGAWIGSTFGVNRSTGSTNPSPM